MATRSYIKLLDRAARALHQVQAASPSIAIVLGSGFAPVLRQFAPELEIPYEKIPGFPRLGVSGHQGKLVLGRAASIPVLFLCGRPHYYEGHTMAEVTHPVRVLARLGLRHLLLTNAAGGINAKYKAGDLMVVSDHINLMGVNPLRGCPPEEGDGFVDLSQLYDLTLRKLLRRAARQARLSLHQGVYLAVSGPSYETPAEIRVFRRWGVDAVGMSTVPEAMMARQCGLKVAALSCITNPAAGLTKTPLTHQEVLATGQSAYLKTSRLLQHFFAEYAQEIAQPTGRRRH